MAKEGLKRLIPMLVVLLGIGIPSYVPAQEEVLGFEGKHGPVWSLRGARPFLIGGYGDNFAYAGEGVVALEGEAEVLLNAEEDTGTMTAVVNGTIHPEKGKTYSGEIKIVYHVAPTDGPAFWEGGVADFVYIHGDTEQGPPVMPRIRTFLAAWAPADVYVNGELVYEGLDGHMMYTERARDTITQAIYANADRTAFYSPMTPSEGYIVAPEERELHLVAHSTVEDPDNFPAHTLWIHINFEEAIEEVPTTAVESGTWGRIKRLLK